MTDQTRPKLPASSLHGSSEEDDTQIGPPAKSTRPPPISVQPALEQKFDENDETRMGLPTPSGLPPPESDPVTTSTKKFDENDETRMGLPTPSGLPPPSSKAAATSTHKFDENDETRTGLPPSKSELPPPVSLRGAVAPADPQDAVDPDEAVTQIADSPSPSSRSK